MTAPLIVFGEDWGAHPSSTQHLIRRVAANRDVLWVNSIGMRRPRLNRADARRVVAKLSAMRNGGASDALRPMETPDRLTVASATAISWPGSQVARRLNRFLIPGSLKSHLSRLDGRPILWTSLPTVIDAVGRFNERAVIYYAGDDFEGLEGVDHEPVGRMERELAKRADLIIAASDVIAAKFPPEKTVVLTHGCDLEMFSTPAPRATDVPAGKVAGFYGSLADWLDYGMLYNLARQRPFWQFQFVGNIQSRSPDLARLMELPNTHFRPAVRHDALPGYVQHWTAAMLPFRDTPQIRACNPLKLREYLATGRPVIATPFPALEPYRRSVRIAMRAEAFALCLDAAANESTSMRRARRAAVAGESWDDRAADVEAMLARLEGQPAPLRIAAAAA